MKKILKNIRGALSRQTGLRQQSARVYLDYAAATPVRREVFEAMQPYFRTVFGNPSAVHGEGVEARKAVEEARDSVARLLTVRPHGITFTSGGTEANNLALYGMVRALHEDKGVSFEDMEIVTSPLEHPSIYEVLNHLTSLGIGVHICPVNEEGLLNKEAFQNLLSEKTVLVSVAYINSEVGTIEDVSALSRIVRKHNKEYGTNILVHIDGSQAPLWVPCAMPNLGVDLMTLDAGKCYGPKGVGVLARKHGVQLKGVMLGGGQENGVRAGTENVPLLVGCAEALRIAQNKELLEKRVAYVGQLRDKAIAYVREQLPQALINGGEGEKRAANNINISLPGIDTEFATVVLDHNGYAVSTKSACSGAGGGGSRVVEALYHDKERAQSTLRISLGEDTKLHEVTSCIDTLHAHCMKMKKALPQAGVETTKN